MMCSATLRATNLRFFYYHLLHWNSSCYFISSIQKSKVVSNSPLAALSSYADEADDDDDDGDPLPPSGAVPKPKLPFWQLPPGSH